MPKSWGEMFSPLELSEDFRVERSLNNKPVKIALYSQRPDGSPDRLVMDWTLAPVTIKAGKYWWAAEEIDA